MKRIKQFFLNDFCILYLIIANAILIFVQEFELKGNVLDYFEPIFTILFIAEMTVKINEKGFSKYISNSWNKLDFILIIISIPSLAVIFYNDSALQLNIFLTLRVFRVFKFFRLIKFFPNVSSLVSSVQRALKASYIIIAGFFLLVFIVSLVTCSLYKNIVPEFFGNPLDSFYSIFRLFSIEGWYEIPDLIATRTSPVIGLFSKLYFIILLLGGGILGLSLVNSIFVDAMVSDNNDELQSEVSKLSDKIEILTKKIDELNNSNNNLNRE
ncbi:MAG: ion transporter [Bacteroidetes bacterium HGW-Bacteroidetes-12]|nr:MAG: ion transporter [Bacteroidetes bacterium HGW-Bacteroidetes-12]